jgi:hypothetical protein
MNFSLLLVIEASTLRVLGALQSPFMHEIGGSPRVREEYIQALADGRGVTAKVRWVSRTLTSAKQESQLVSLRWV